MNQAFKPDVRSIVVDEVFPHSPQVVWKALTDGGLIARWMMIPRGFEPKVGARFTFQTKPAGEWDGVIHCEILELTPNARLSYAWTGGHESNEGYGSKLETTVTFTLASEGTGTRLRLVHSGFVVPTNETAFRNMSEGWKKVVGNLDRAIREDGFSQTDH